jgi:CBS domain containing-hemolysin-like protein
VIVNEYSLVVGVVTLNDVMSTVMGELVSPPDEEQIVRATKIPGSSTA